MYLCLAAIAIALSVAILRSAEGDTLVLTHPGVVHPGSTVDLPITLKTASKDLSALEWQVSTQPGVPFEVTSSVSGKTVQCYKQHCMLYGGRTPLQPGAIANLRIHLPSVAAANVSIVLHDVLAATNEAAPRKIGNGRANLTVQP